MGNQVRADLDVLSGVAGKLANDFEQLQQSIMTLQGQSQQHSATWEGQASAKYAVAMADVNSAWGQLNSVLSEIQSNITTSGSHYDNTDNTNASGFNSVQATDISAALRG